jgi:hypothetical protein
MLKKSVFMEKKDKLHEDLFEKKSLSADLNDEQPDLIDEVICPVPKKKVKLSLNSAFTPTETVKSIKADKDFFNCSQKNNFLTLFHHFKDKIRKNQQIFQFFDFV